MWLLQTVFWPVRPCYSNKSINAINNIYLNIEHDRLGCLVRGPSNCHQFAHWPNKENFQSAEQKLRKAKQPHKFVNTLGHWSEGGWEVDW